VTVIDRGPGSVLVAGTSGRADVSPKIDIEISKDSIGAGNLIFAISNESRFLIQEIILIPLPRSEGSPSGAGATSTVAVNDADSELLGDSTLEPGQSLSVSVHLCPGEYAIFVNSLGIFADMIWACLTVTA
jgi:hypothetical protein